ncbi:hypothetical protein QTP86_010329 [Hemibagrus guttatus]|nr:hypothetical protein QTP86_010329 [Hemibagrus guttatus]
MKVSRSKTEYMCVNEREGSGTVRLQGEEVKKVQEFKYLGSTVQCNGECGKDVKKRVQAGWNGWRKVWGVLCERKISARIKAKVYRTVVRAAMLYGLETVSLRKRQESELEVAELKMLRFSLGVTRLDRIRNEYIRGTAHVGRLGDKVREARLRWFGHVQRRESSQCRDDNIGVIWSYFLDLPGVVHASMEDNNSDVLVRDRGCLRSDIENTSTRSTVGARTCRMMESPTITASCHSGGEVLTRGLASVFRCCCNCTQAPWYLSPGVNGTWTGHILGALGLERETRGIELVEVLVSYRKFTWDSHGGKDDLCHTLSPHNADFAFSLYNKLSNKADAKGKNIFFSPLSISMALSMLALGAKGETKSQIFSTLGYSSLTEDHVNEAYEHLLHMLDHSQEAMLLETGGGLAVREGFKPVDKFLKNLQHFYQAEAFTVDFSKSDVAVQEINKFIAKKTKDTITDMVKSLDTDTIMVLINYIYFRADFHVDEKTKVTVDMMKRTRRYDIHDVSNFTSVIMVLYKGNTSMMIVLDNKGTMEEVEKHLSKEDLSYWHDKLFRSSVDLYLPKFSISASFIITLTI